MGLCNSCMQNQDEQSTQPLLNKDTTGRTTAFQDAPKQNSTQVTPVDTSYSKAVVIEAKMAPKPEKSRHEHAPNSHPHSHAHPEPASETRVEENGTSTSEETESSELDPLAVAVPKEDTHLLQHELPKSKPETETHHHHDHHHDHHHGHHAEHADHADHAHHDHANDVVQVTPKHKVAAAEHFEVHAAAPVHEAKAAQPEEPSVEEHKPESAVVEAVASLNQPQEVKIETVQPVAEEQPAPTEDVKDETVEPVADATKETEAQNGDTDENEEPEAATVSKAAPANKKQEKGSNNNNKSGGSTSKNKKKNKKRK